MHTSEFWTIIESARSAAGPDKPFHEALVDELTTHSEEAIFRYQERFDDVHDAVYRWDVWAAAYLIGGGCSDDSFIDFRAGLIALGRDWYEKAAACPDNLAEHPAVIAAVGATDYEAIFYEDVNYAADGAFECVTGGDKDFDTAWTQYAASRECCSGHESGDMGEDFDFDDSAEMHRRLPRLAALYLRDTAHQGS